MLLGFADLKASLLKRYSEMVIIEGGFVGYHTHPPKTSPCGHCWTQIPLLFFPYLVAPSLIILNILSESLLSQKSEGKSTKYRGADVDEQ